MAFLRETSRSVRILLFLVAGFSLFVSVSGILMGTADWTVVLTIVFGSFYLVSAIRFQQMMKSVKWVRIFQGLLLVSTLVTMVSDGLSFSIDKTTALSEVIIITLINVLIAWYLIANVQRLSEDARGLRVVVADTAPSVKRQGLYWLVLITFIALIILAFWHFIA